MTNKILIDGIDVSKCVYALAPKKQCPNKSMLYAKETSCAVCKEKITQHNFCKNNPNCYYKQLKRKEQECEALQQSENEAGEIIAELKEENYQLQKNCQICEDFIDGIPCKPLRDMDYDLQKVINQQDNYKQALDEIEEVCKIGVYDEFRRPLDECSVILNIINKTKEQK